MIILILTHFAAFAVGTLWGPVLNWWIEQGEIKRAGMCPDCNLELIAVRTHKNDDDIHYTCRKCGRDFDESGHEMED